MREPALLLPSRARLLLREPLAPAFSCVNLPCSCPRTPAIIYNRFWHPQAYGYPRYEQAVEEHWGFVVEGGAGDNYTAPLFISEFGTCHGGLECIQEVVATPTPTDVEGGRSITMDIGKWFSFVTRYLRRKDLDFAYWALNGSTCKGTSRESGAEEGYGLLNMCWNAYVYPPLLEALQALQAPDAASQAA